MGSSKWVQLRQAQLAKETAQSQAEMLRLQQEERQRLLDQQTREADAVRQAAMAEREAREARAANGSAIPPPPMPDASGRVAELEARVASLEERVQWCIERLQAPNG